MRINLPNFACTGRTAAAGEAGVGRTTTRAAEWTKVERLADGRLRFSIRHEVLAGVIPAMLVWWFNNMDGTLRIGDVDVPRYRVWHPRDHVALTYLRPGLDGRKFSTGARIHIQEFFGGRTSSPS